MPTLNTTKRIRSMKETILHASVKKLHTTQKLRKILHKRKSIFYNTTQNNRADCNTTLLPPWGNSLGYSDKFGIMGHKLSVVVI